MDCRSCGHELRRGERFCPSCGVAGAECHGCGGELPEGARFCPACGAAAGAPAGDHEPTPRLAGRERKVVTLLFADVVDYTALNEAHDPEIVAARVSAAFERLAREVARYEGTVEKYAGDAMLAVFGVPAAHEDDPERAVRAALEMQELMRVGQDHGRDRPQLSLRIGIESGEVLVDSARAAAERDLFVTGDAVNTAARLQTAAEPGAVIVGPATYGATRHIFGYVALPEVELKGKSSPVASWRAIAVRTGRRGRRARFGLQAPFVGREAELSRLKETVRGVVDDGHPYLISVIGSAGVGKSRLAWELEKHLDGLPDIFHWRKGRCLAYADRSLGPIADVIRFDAGISEDDAPEVVRETLEARLEALPLNGGRTSIRAALEAVLGIGEGRELPRETVFEAVRSYLQAIAEVQPLILVMEDIHWADEGTLSFLDLLARWGEGRMAILCLARHELLEQRPGWGGGLSRSATITLEPLEAEASGRLLVGLLGTRVPDSLTDRVASMSEGNPLFAEEMVRMLMDQGVLRFTDDAWQLARPLDEIEMPDTVQAVLSARLDSLPRGEKRTAQVAAVIGRIFWDLPLAHLTGSGLDIVGQYIRGLRVKDLVVPREPSSLADAREYGFRHVLIRDVAYESLRKGDRARLHRDVARWVQDSLPDRAAELAELVAGQLITAVRYEEELGLRPDAGLAVLREETLATSLSAARRAASLGQLRSACRWMRTAAELARALGRPAREIAGLVDRDTLGHWYMEDIPAHMRLLSDSIDDLERLAEPTADDRQLLARLRAALGLAFFSNGETDHARSVLRHGIDELLDEPPSPGRARLQWALGWTYWRAGPVDPAPSWLARALEDAEASGDAVTRRWALHDLGIATSMLTDPLGGLELVEESYRLALGARDAALVSRCANNVPVMGFQLGRPLEPLTEMAASELGRARMAGQLPASVYTAGNLGQMHLAMGDLDGALAYEAENLAATVPGARGLGGVPRDPAYRAVLHLRRGDRAAARADETRARMADEPPEPQTAGETAMVWAVLDWQRDPHAGMAMLTRSMEVPELELVGREVAARMVARMAFRLGDEGALRQAAGVVDGVGLKGEPVLDARRRWVAGLAAAGGGEDVEDAAATLEEHGYLTDAFDAWTDAALLATRDGRASRSSDRAREIAERTGLHDVLGPLPPSRSVSPEHP